MRTVRNMIALTMLISGMAGAVAANAPTLGVNHIGLAVSNLDASASFFIDTLGWRRAGGDADYPAIFVTDGEAFVTLWQVENPAEAVAFDRKKNVGLHHLAITVESLDALHALHAKFLQTKGVTIEFAPEFMGQGPTTHMMIRDPSGLRLEFILPGSRMPKAGNE
ncbi:VOC family protein [Kordiimonas lacus]|uniref:Lactoylglutathione lyase n=1 Tax=Kordiimonas lacus TaxID=637679 RepID=A0A1G6YHX2_9PROT|nr:VOC family protein [Kordiimonas lacus]SDD89958.1 lactoylglutathione lyase [Kordiimonas lacus]